MGSGCFVFGFVGATWYSHRYVPRKLAPSFERGGMSVRKVDMPAG